MSTRSITCVIHRDYAQNDTLGFALNPSSVAEHSHVNFYVHHDGYPEFHGVELATWILANKEILGDGSKLAAKLVHDFWYEGTYLYESPDYMDHQYTYTIWVGDQEKIHIGCYDQYASHNVFVLKPKDLIKEYKRDKNYTKWSEGEKRFKHLLHPSGYD